MVGPCLIKSRSCPKRWRVPILYFLGGRILSPRGLITRKQHEALPIQKKSYRLYDLLIAQLVFTISQKNFQWPKENSPFLRPSTRHNHLCTQPLSRRHEHLTKINVNYQPVEKLEYGQATDTTGAFHSSYWDSPKKKPRARPMYCCINTNSLIQTRWNNKQSTNNF